eukprot:IDg17877t1
MSRWPLQLYAALYVAQSGCNNGCLSRTGAPASVYELPGSAREHIVLFRGGGVESKCSQHINSPLSVLSHCADQSN